MDETIDMTSGLDLAWDKAGLWTRELYSLLPNIIAGTIILFLFCLIAYLLKRGIDRYFARKDRIDLGRLLSDIAFWLLAVVGLLVALTIIVPSIRPVDLISGLGLGSLAIGFAFKDILQNWFSGLLILLRMPFRRGDQIKIGDAEGTVQSIEPRATVLRTYDGRNIVVPNTDVYTSHVIVHTFNDTRRVEMDITVGYDYDTDYIIAIIQKALKPINEILGDPAPQVLCWELGATSLGVKIRWWIESSRASEVISRARAVQAIKQAFEVNDIDPTDPQMIYYKEQDASGGQKKAIGKGAKHIEEAPPPQIIRMGVDDPETEDPKDDPKEKTLIPQ